MNEERRTIASNKQVTILLPVNVSQRLNHYHTRARAIFILWGSPNRHVECRLIQHPTLNYRIIIECGAYCTFLVQYIQHFNIYVSGHECLHCFHLLSKCPSAHCDTIQHISKLGIPHEQKFWSIQISLFSNVSIVVAARCSTLERREWA